MGQTQFEAYFIDLYLHYSEHCLLHCVSLPPEYNDHSELWCTWKLQKGLEFPQRM